MLARLSLKSRLIVPITVCIAAFAAALYFVGDSIVQQIVISNLKELSDKKVADLYAAQESIANLALQEAALFSKSPKVIEAYNLAYQGNISNENDPFAQEAREMLISYMSSYEQGLAAGTGREEFRIHFHLPPARSLLRLWKKDQTKSDDLRSFRNTIKNISTPPHKVITGIEVGVGGFAIRGLVPVLDPSGKYLGSIESLSSYEPLVKSSASHRLENISVYMNKELLPIATRLQDQSKNPIVADRFVFVTSTNPTLMNQLVSKELLVAGASETETAREGNHFLTSFPVNDYSGKQIGILVYAYDAKEPYRALEELRLGVGLLSALLLITISGTLYLSVSSVAKPLNASAEEMSTGAIEVASASSEIAQISNLLASSASEQAASLAQTTESINHLSESSKENADSASKAKSIVEQVSKRADNTKQAVADLTTTMKDIKSASDDSVGIIKAIEDIAFQTNLLALNAAVEAARAGDMGKGFAVVAEEVRALAQRSAEASKQSADLIGRSSTSAQVGVNYSNEVDKAFIEIASDLKKITEAVIVIASGSQDQAVRIREITNAISNLDLTTQALAASAEEGAASSEELNAQSESMKQAVKKIEQIILGLRDT